MPHTDTTPVSASVASIGTSIRYVGNWVYAYSGGKQVNGGAQVLHLDFTSGSGIIVGQFMFSGPCLPANLPTGQVTLFRIKFNNEIVNLIKVETVSEDMPSILVMPIVIPPVTHVVIQAENGDSTANMVTSCNLTGRVYGAV